ncbi:hypothetical protein FBU30_008824 [Linnemannia zychae]|nr:hypothetical protein FBU30_008824 [Linnemannia zychae]
MDFRSVGFTIEKMLSARLSKSSTVLHIDGQRSVEKLAHRKRDQALSKRLETLERDHAEGKTTSHKTALQTYKGIPTEHHQRQQLPFWKLWASVAGIFVDAAIKATSIINNAVDPDHFRIIIKDSDLMAFKSTTSITMPIKKVWTIFCKSKLLENHDLSTPSHLTLATLVSSNNYTNGVPSYGLTSNVDIIHQIGIEGLDGSVGQERMEAYQTNVMRCLDVVHKKA